MAIRARNENIPFTIIIIKLITLTSMNHSREKVKALVPFMCGETNDSKKFKIIQVSIHDDILMNN